MKKLFVLGFLLFSIGLTSQLHAQAYWTVHFGPSFPMGKFASDDVNDDESGAAAVGLNVGLQYVYPLSETGFGLFGGLDFNYNGLKKGFKDDVEEYYEYLGIYNPEIKYYNYINVPLSGGLNYAYQADDKIGVFANAGLVLNFLKITDMEIEAEGETFTTEVDLASKLGFKIGGGLLLNKKTSISIDYFGLGDHNIDGEMKSTWESEDIKGKAKVDFVTLTLGIRF